LSVHAGNPSLISIDWLVDRGWISPHDQGDKTALLHKAYNEFCARKNDALSHEFELFKTEEHLWLDDFALYSTIRQLQKKKPWMQWPAELRDRDQSALNRIIKNQSGEIEQQKFVQFVFFKQWLEIRNYARQHGVQLFGDMPIFVAHDSADVWAHRSLFTIDAAGNAQFVAGVPPDYFSENGQRWGNPLYNWESMHEDNYEWWIQRIRTQLKLFDFIRIDHFRGFEACWQIPATAKTAIEGKWVKAPGKALLKSLYDAFGSLPLVAEDLGIITDEVIALRDEFGLPGMNILQFAFDGSAHNPYLPHNHIQNSVVYTGTHDNDTASGWYQTLSHEDKARINQYLGYDIEHSMPWSLIRCALASVARLAIIPMQDLLGLGSEGRMNTPSTTVNNWRWRFSWEQVPEDVSEKLNAMIHLYGRK
ncbi:MAG: 4-alpha-glucanotransferase, partial [Gammaproteobacteria bacterium]|nr:4-alpha-glucanotransferase [Gammaproteobacteria bacterium]